MPTETKMPTETNSKSPFAENLSELIVALSLQCAHCGYDLQGLYADGDCPECGEPIRLTVIETIDPASRRLAPILNPKIIGNSISGVVCAFFFSTLLAAFAFLINSPSILPVPEQIRLYPSSAFLWGAAGIGFLSILLLVPIMRMCQRSELSGCRGGILLTLSGTTLWSFSMLGAIYFLFQGSTEYPVYTMLFDALLPIISSGLVFSGFRKLIPRLGQRSRAFRQAQGSRQRMNDLLAALVMLVIGRTLIAISTEEANLAILGLIVIVISISFILIGLAYVLRNTLWIRNALITPPPALSDLLHLA